MSAKVITVAQQKGGAGKTTLTAELAVAFAGNDRRVALIDIDPQASLAQWHRVRSQQPAASLAQLTLSEISGWKLPTELDRLRYTHDLILIDSPPHAATEARVAVRCAHLVLVPLQPSPMDLWATGPTIAFARAAGVPILIVLNRAPSRSKVVDLTRRQLGEQDLPVARAAIGNRVTFASSMLEGRSVLELSPKSMAAAEIRTLVEEIGARL
jgi:chromosome partitioning protein